MNALTAEVLHHEMQIAPNMQIHIKLQFGKKQSVKLNNKLFWYN